jgi:glycosyltransferase involved in cell wall biosynthesis
LIGAIGNVTPRKGAHYLVRALPRILAAAPDTMVMLVGEALSARYVAEVRATAEKLDVAAHLLWLGHRDDVDAIMAAMDVCVLPSLSEPLGMAILEAMAAGLPVVATTVGGIPECLGDCPAGKLVPPADSEALAGAVVELLCNPTQRRTCGEEGRRRVREHFSAESQTPCIEAVLARVARYKTAA